MTWIFAIIVTVDLLLLAVVLFLFIGFLGIMREVIREVATALGAGRDLGTSLNGRLTNVETFIVKAFALDENPSEGGSDPSDLKN